jgi:SAM-dependent methyltransferase
MRRYPTIVLALLLASCVAVPGSQAEPIAQALRPANPRYEPTSPDVVEAMLKLASVSAADVVYDLGCGDGRIVIMAASRFGASGVCVDIDPQRIAESRVNAGTAGVADRIRFVNEDLLATDLRGATVVTLFLSSELNLALRPKLARELAPGARVVSHWHAMGDWRPERAITVQSEMGERHLYLWTMR